MIYCVEDDLNIQELIVYTLNSTGYPAKGFSSATDFFPALAQVKPELILLDVMLPGQSGVEILAQLKSTFSTQTIPVILLTAKSSEYDKVQGLELGADDYVTKPFGIMELVARIKALLRRTQSNLSKSKLHYKNISVDPSQHLVLVDQEEIQLTLKEFNLLLKLMENESIVLTREQLIEDVWGYDYYGETRTVDAHIRTLRFKLKHAGQWIETVRGVGYKLTSHS
ncbi:MAG: winged helix-turn-helix domain-containing protein [Anaerorhabdus sp.]